jgi:hypothetical protein
MNDRGNRSSQRFPAPSSPNGPCRSCLQDAPERRAFHVTRRPTRRRVSQPIAHGGELTDLRVQLSGLCSQQLTIDARLACGREHARHFFEGEPGRASQRDQRESFQHVGVEQAAQAAPAYGRDEPLLLVEAQCRRRNVCPFRDFVDIQIPHPLDLKST